MKTSQKVSFLVIATLGVLLGMVHLFWPGGLPGLAARLSAPAPKAPAPERIEAPATAQSRPTSVDALRQADAAYDAGDFARAMDLYLAGRTDADHDFAARSARGLSKSVLAWALTTNVPVPSPLPDDPDSEIARRQAAADRAQTQSEQAWYDLTIYAAGCGSARKLPFLTRQAIDFARTGGPVETRLKSVLEIAGPRARHLRAAMEELGFLQPVDPVATAERAGPAAKLPSRPTISPPGGNFTPAMKTKLAEAVELEKKGTAEYDLCGPDNANRKEHRKASYDLLKRARDIYETAQEEDSNSASLDRRMHDVMEMISHLRKEMSLGD